MKDMNQDRLIDLPNFGVLQFQFQQTPTYAGEGCTRLEHERLGPVVMATIVQKDQEKAVESKEMVHMQFHGEGVIFDIEKDQCHFFEDEETRQDGEERPRFIRRSKDMVSGNTSIVISDVHR